MSVSDQVLERLERAVKSKQAGMTVFATWETEVV